ncbi:hypothetical protein CPT_Mater125 [Bacillus phage Mater]|uniref:Uncharacterized protein n=1 Tax=Bacillus phage Mater TaxID=1540090 RepID=A0A0A0RMS7_9CAUD|nr:hypothetical protein CPT_Mater125 [Bacillus phage Mater]AIW03282.1 hypothetical protein CPT_Mater125 [Bacillus phage Mater]
MKTNIEYENGTLTITSLDGDMKAEIEVATGITELTYIEATIDRLHAFTHAVRSRYRKFVTSQALEDFIE